MFRLFSLIAAACLAALCWASARPAEAQAASSAGPAAARPEAQPMTQGFRDDFDRLDPARWYVSDGWTNGPHQDCTWSRRAVRVQGGMLRLTHLPGGGETPHPLCGEIRTRGFLQYGLIEARIRTPRGSGKNAALFTFSKPSGKGPHDEIDIEILTRNPAEATFNTFVDGKPAQGGVAPVDPPFDEAFHTVAIDWAPERIRWFVDGRMIHETAPGIERPTHPQQLFLSFWSTTTLTDWMGRQDANAGPLDYEVDWIAWTPHGAGCLFPQSLACR